MTGYDRTRSTSIASMFGEIAGHYDLLNFVMTLGQDQRWRRRAAQVARLRPGDTALDVATGTGDLAFELARHVIPGGRVIGVDFADPMLALARNKAERAHLPVQFQHADALHLPFASGTFAAVTCAFGLRNMADRPAALAEMARVTRPGGRVVILELTPPQAPLTAWYMNTVLPALGQFLAGSRAAYTYLPQSAQTFPSPTQLAATLASAGLRDITYRLFNFGTVALHDGVRD